MRRLEELLAAEHSRNEQLAQTLKLMEEGKAVNVDGAKPSPQLLSPGANSSLNSSFGVQARDREFQENEL